MAAPPIKQDVIIDVKGLTKLRRLGEGLRGRAQEAKRLNTHLKKTGISLSAVDKALAKSTKTTKTLDKAKKEVTKTTKAQAKAEDKLQKEVKQTAAATKVANKVSRERVQSLKTLVMASHADARATRAKRAAMQAQVAKPAGSFHLFNQAALSGRSSAEIAAIRAERAQAKAGLVRGAGSLSVLAKSEQRMFGRAKIQHGDLKQTTSKLVRYGNEIEKLNNRIGKHQRLILRGVDGDKKTLKRRENLVQQLKRRRTRLKDMIAPLEKHREKLVEEKASTLNLRKAKRQLARDVRVIERLQKKYNRTGRESIAIEIRKRRSLMASRAEMVKQRVALDRLAGAQARSNRTGISRNFAHGASGAIGALGGSLRNVATSVLFHATSGGVFAVLGAIAALRIAFSGIIKPAAVFEKSLALVAKTTKMSKESITEYGEEILKMSSSLAIGRQELVSISMIAGQMGIRGSENLKKFTKTIAYMTRVSEIGSEEAASGIAAMAVSFNLPIAAAEHMGSVLNEMGNHSTANAAKLIQAMSVMGKVAQQFGLTFAETGAITATLIEGMKSPSRAGVAFRSIMTDMRSRQTEISSLLGRATSDIVDELETKPLETLMHILQELATLDPMQYDKISKQIFGRRHQQAVRILAENVGDLEERLGIANEAFANGTSLMKEHARAMNNAASSWERIGHAVKNFFTGVGSKINPWLQDIAYDMTALEDIPTAELLQFFQHYGGGTTLQGAGKFRDKELIGSSGAKLNQGASYMIELIRRAATTELKPHLIDELLEGVVDNEGDVVFEGLYDQIASLKQQMESVNPVSSWFKGLEDDLELLEELKDMLEGGKLAAEVDVAINIRDMDKLADLREYLQDYVDAGILYIKAHGGMDQKSYEAFLEKAGMLSDVDKAQKDAAQAGKDFDVYADPALIGPFERIVEQGRQARVAVNEVTEAYRELQELMLMKAETKAGGDMFATGRIEALAEYIEAYENTLAPTRATLKSLGTEKSTLESNIANAIRERDQKYGKDSFAWKEADRAIASMNARLGQVKKDLGHFQSVLKVLTSQESKDRFFIDYLAANPPPADPMDYNRERDIQHEENLKELDRINELLSFAAGDPRDEAEKSIRLRNLIDESDKLRLLLADLDSKEGTYPSGLSQQQKDALDEKRLEQRLEWSEKLLANEAEIHKLQEEALEKALRLAEELAQKYEYIASIFTDLIHDSVSMLDALGLMNDAGRDFARSLVNSVDASARLLANIERIKAAKAAGEAASSLAVLGPMGAAAGAALGIITSVIGLFGAGNRLKRRQEQEEADNTSVSVSRSITEVQGNALVNIGQQQVYWLRRIAMGLHPTWSASNRTFLPGSRNLSESLAPSVNIEKISVEVPLDPDNRTIGQAIGQAITTQGHKRSVRRAIT